jgi:hypothetical protein
MDRGRREVLLGRGSARQDPLAASELERHRETDNSYTHRTRKHDLEMQSVAVSADAFARFDAVVISRTRRCRRRCRWWWTRATRCLWRRERARAGTCKWRETLGKKHEAAKGLSLLWRR